MRMQREAQRRVSRMQEHSRRVFEEHGGGFPPPPPRGTQAAGFTQPVYRPTGLYARPAPPCEPTPPAPCADTPVLAKKTGFSLDGEQWLLLGLALLLFRSGCRPELAMALVYLAL